MDDQLKNARRTIAELRLTVMQLEKRVASTSLLGGRESLDLPRWDYSGGVPLEVRAALDQLREAMRPNAAVLNAALDDFASWSPHDGGNEDYAALFTKLDEWRGGGMYTPENPDNLAEEPGDHRAPFLSEAFLYNLLGKEDARSFLVRWRNVLRALGVSEQVMRARGWA